MIRATGGRAVASAHDVADFDEATALVDLAVASFGRLDVVVNNAGILRDRMIVNTTPQEWDDVIRVHLRRTFAVLQAAARHWRLLAKAGTPVAASIVNTSSPSGLYGKPGQANYGAAKVGIATLTMIAADEPGAVRRPRQRRRTRGLHPDDRGPGHRPGCRRRSSPPSASRRWWSGSPARTRAT